DAHASSAPEALRNIVRRDTFTCTTVRVIAHGGNEQMGLVANIAARRGYGIGTRRERPRQSPQFLGIEYDREGRDQINELASRNPFLGLTIGEQCLDVLVAGGRRIGLNC